MRPSLDNTRYFGKSPVSIKRAERWTLLVAALSRIDPRIAHLTASWIDENEKREKWTRRWCEKKNRMRRWWQWRGTEEKKQGRSWSGGYSSFVVSWGRRKSRVNFDPFFSSGNNNLGWTNGRGNLCPFCARGNAYELRRGKAYSSLEEDVTRSFTGLVSRICSVNKG